VFVLAAFAVLGLVLVLFPDPIRRHNAWALRDSPLHGFYESEDANLVLRVIGGMFLAGVAVALWLLLGSGR
jgi:hypothetical protein